MAKNKTPEYKYHVSGQAVVYFGGRCFYLGKHGTTESWTRFYSLLAEYSSTGRVPQSTGSVPKKVTVKQVADEFRTRRIPEVYNSERSKGTRIKYERVCDHLSAEPHGSMPVDEFGPRALADLRDTLVAGGIGRSWVNEQVRDVITIFRYAVSRELIGPERVEALKSLSPLKRGESTATEAKARKPVSIEDLAATMEHLSPVVQGIIRLQLATGARPSEILGITPGEINRTGETWLYEPSEHKTSDKGKLRVLALNADAQAALAPFMSRPDDLPCFSPKESAQWYRDRKTAQRVTPSNAGNAVGRRSQPRGESKIKDEYNSTSYRQAVIRAAEKAGVPKWTPYQIRHLTATAVADQLGIEGAKALLGHSDAAITQVYTSTARQAAIKAAQAAPNLPRSGGSAKAG